MEKILISGNEAMAKAAIDAGCYFYAGYPITPQNELTAYMSLHMPKLNRVFIQAESEIAAINMVFGASAAGVRSMTSSSSPGISLKQEGISYIAGAELPAVIINVMRGGPGLGNIAPSQSDYFQATKGGGHGDYRLMVLAPSSVQEAYELTQLAFELADKYRNPAMILGDGLLGQMMEPLVVNGQWSVVNGKRKRLSTIDYRPSTKRWALTGCKGRKPNIIKSFYMYEGGLEEFNKVLEKKYADILEHQQRWEEISVDDADLIVVAYGTMARICRGAIMKLRQCRKRAGLVRPISLWPFPKKAFGHDPQGKRRYLAIEMSHGQMVEDLKLAVGSNKNVSFFGRSGGGIPSEEEIIDRISKII